MNVIRFSIPTAQTTIILLACGFAFFYAVLPKEKLNKWRLLNWGTVGLFLLVSGYAMLTRMTLSFLTVLYTVCFFTVSGFTIALYTNSYSLTKIQEKRGQNEKYNELVFVTSLPIALGISKLMFSRVGFLGNLAGLGVFLFGGTGLTYLTLEIYRQI